MHNVKTKRKDAQRIKEEEDIILDYDMDLYSDYEENITARVSDKVPSVKDEYEIETEFILNFIFRG